MAPGWKLPLQTILAVVVNCPTVTRGCPRTPCIPSWEEEPYKSRILHCERQHYVPPRTPPAFHRFSGHLAREHYLSRSARDPDHLLCLINTLTDDRSPSFQHALYVEEGHPVELDCYPLESVPRGIHIRRAYFPGFQDHATGLYYWTKDARQFCHKWGGIYPDQQCGAPVELDHSAPDEQVWIKSFTTAHAGLYACVYIENCNNWCSLRVGPAYRLHVASKKEVATLDAAQQVTSDATKSFPPVKHTEMDPPMSSAGVVTLPAVLLHTQWFSTAPANGVLQETNTASYDAQGKASKISTNTSAQSIAFQSVPSDVPRPSATYTEIFHSGTPLSTSIPSPSPSVSAAMDNEAITPTTRALSTGFKQSAAFVNPSLWKMDAVSAAHTRDVADAEDLSVTAMETINSTPLSIALPNASIIDEETVTVDGGNETESAPEFDWVPSDQRRHTRFPPECPACSGNCPCPPSKRKRKHL
ncbi:uncharacterized protein LOC129597000 [Paramacrobiotus metropolitanus]|uniref:uncharacterized protein LOC129597000 n=1 Tax=Paramacrobiotus metropolitanus TaxID=2943436 RepID=UPI00244585F5|nr:uncharacterized protein LOC129597000 [Paramacrobiotus metropolitanus]